MRKTITRLLIVTGLLALAGCNGASTRIDPATIGAKSSEERVYPNRGEGSRIRIHIIPRGLKTHETHDHCPVCAGPDGLPAGTDPEFCAEHTPTGCD